MAASWGTLDELMRGNAHQVCVGTESHFSPNPITAHTLFDLASLTKILATTSFFMRLHELNRIRLDEPYPNQPFTFRQLLTHTSGLPAWKPFYESMKEKFGTAESLKSFSMTERKAHFYSLVNAVPLESSPGTRVVYSDLGFLYLSQYVETLEKEKYFCDQVKDLVWSQIEGCGLHFRPGPTMAQTSGIAATEVCPWRGLLQGEVHDDNCWSMGGVAGHAGVFGSLNDVIAWARSLLTQSWVSPQTLETFSEIMMDSTGIRRAVGFDVPAGDGSGSTARVLSEFGTLGHLGFTGTSFWIDLAGNRFAILLTNRVHPTRDDSRIRELRRLFHESAF